MNSFLNLKPRLINTNICSPGPEMVKSGEIRAVYQKCSLEPDEDTSDKVFQSNSEFFIKCLDKSGFVRTSDSPHTE